MKNLFNKMRKEVFIQKQYTESISCNGQYSKYGKPFYVVYTLTDCEYVNIIGNTIKGTIKKIRENKALVFRGKIDKQSCN